MDLNKKLEELKPYQLNCNVFDVYSYNGLTMQDLLCQFFTKINECITVSNETIDLAKWLVNEGLEIEVVKKLMIWLEDGTLENIINVNLFNTLNEKINGLSSQLEHITTNLSYLKLLNSNESDDVTEIMQEYLDNYNQIELPPNKTFMISTLRIRQKQIIKGNFSTIKAIDNNDAMIKYDGGSLACYDLKMRNKGNDFINMEIEGDASGKGTHVKLFNCEFFGHGGLNDYGVKMKQNDFSSIENCYFWYVGYPITVSAGQRGSTQLSFKTIGISECKVGVTLGGCDKVTLQNVDVARCDIGFKMTNQCSRIVHENCHVENFNEYGFFIPSDKYFTHICYRYCTTLEIKCTSIASFYCGQHLTYGVQGLIYDNCIPKITENCKGFIVNANCMVYGENYFNNSIFFANSKFVTGYDGVSWGEVELTKINNWQEYQTTNVEYNVDNYKVKLSNLKGNPYFVVDYIGNGQDMTLKIESETNDNIQVRILEHGGSYSEIIKGKVYKGLATQIFHFKAPYRAFRISFNGEGGNINIKDIKLHKGII